MHSYFTYKYKSVRNDEIKEIYQWGEGRIEGIDTPLHYSSK